MIELNRIYKMSCVDGMKLIDDDCVDLIVTSPPYNIGAGGSSFKFKGYDIYEDKNDDYDKFILEVLNESYRILKPSGSLMFNHKVRTVDKTAIHPLKNIFKSKLILKQEIIWDLNDTHIHNKDRFFPINEMIYWCVKDRNQTFFNSECAKFTTIWKMKRANKKEEGCVGHPAPFTLELPSRCIESLSKKNDLVLDPFMGSGTVAVSAKRLGRNYIGFDISDDYIDLAEKRIQSSNYIYV